MYGEATVSEAAKAVSITQNTNEIKPFVEIGYGEYSDLFEESVVTQKMNLGSTIIHKATHPALGNILMVDAGNERIGLIAI